MFSKTQKKLQKQRFLQKDMIMLPNASFMFPDAGALALSILKPRFHSEFTFKGLIFECEIYFIKMGIRN